MTEMMTTFIVLENTDHEELAAQVTHKLDQGYQLQGNLVGTRVGDLVYYAQGLIFVESVE